ncbi:MAG TPA: c-type cytochrome, partial [Planctomycetaceae bacterium]|nr:c-type cytochrome [Planctomycetaceae bacterium]
GEGLESLNALWALYQAFGLEDDTALAALQHPYPMTRYWAVRLICDDVGFAHKRTAIELADSLGELPNGPTEVSHSLFHAILEQTAREDNAEVRSQMAGSARRLPADQGLSLVTAVLKHSEDIDDLYVPLLCWWVLEMNLDRDRDAVMALFENADFRREPMVVRHILSRMMRGLALKGKNHDLQQCARLLELAENKEQVDQLLTGFEQAFAGRRMVGLPENLAKALVDSGRSSLELRVRLGDEAATTEAIAVLANDKAAVDERAAVARTLGEVKAADSVEPLLNVALTATDSGLQRAALTAVSVFDNPAIAERVLSHFAKFPEDVRPAFFDVMFSRIEWTHQLMNAIADGTIAEKDIPGDVAVQLRTHADPSIASLAVQHLGAGEALNPADVRQRVQQVRDVLDDGTGNPYAGEATFMTRCAACHKLFHKGGKVGPDLTPYQRGNLETLLTSVIAPSTEIREGFEYMAVVTVEGRILSGFLVDQDNQIITLRVKAGEDVRIERKDVDEIAPVGRSLMPDGLLQGLDDQQIRDFFAYLRISQPISQ